jgi:hypothetical protein
MASGELSRRVGKVGGCPPLAEMGDHQRREFHEALLDANGFEDMPGKWQAAVLKAEENRPKLRVDGGDWFRGAPDIRARRHGAPLLCMDGDSATVAEMGDRTCPASDDTGVVRSLVV